MLDEGLDPKEIKSALGLSTQRVTLLRAVYLGMKQMRSDPDFSDQAKPELFSMFVEALNRPVIRDWLGWNREAGRMENEDARHQFYRPSQLSWRVKRISRTSWRIPRCHYRTPTEHTRRLRIHPRTGNPSCVETWRRYATTSHIPQSARLKRMT